MPPRFVDSDVNDEDLSDLRITGFQKFDAGGYADAFNDISLARQHAADDFEDDEDDDSWASVTQHTFH